MTEGRLRPAQRLARQARGESLDAADAGAALMAELNEAALVEAEELAADAARIVPEPPLRGGRHSGDLAAEMARRVAQVNGEPDHYAAEPVYLPDPELEATGPEDTLFGPLALTYSAEQRHLAAWELYKELADLRARETAESDLPQRLEELHADNGHGYCRGCGHGDNGAYTTLVAACLTRIEMDR